MSSTMDTEKEKPALEKSNSIPASRGENIGNRNDDPQPDQDSQESHVDVNRDGDQEQPPESTTVDEGENSVNKGDDDDDDVQVSEVADQITEEDKEMGTTSNVEQPSPLPPDLKKVSEEIDQYISSLTSPKEDESVVHLDVPIFVEQFAVLVEAKIEDYDGEPPVKWTQLNDEQCTSFSEAIDRVSKLSSLLSKFSSDFKFVYSINRIGGVLQRGISYLEEEFRSLLEDHRVADSSDQSNNNDSKPTQDVSSGAGQDGEQSSEPEATSIEENKGHSAEYPEEILSNLNRLAKCMIVGGHDTECCQVYFLARRNAMEESLQKLGFEKHSIDDVQKMQWESLERDMVSWIRIFKHCMSQQLPDERKLSDAIFSDYPLISKMLFSSLSRVMLIQLLNFAEAAAMTKRAAEKLFKFLDVYETLRDALPSMDELFLPQSVEDIKSDTTLIKSRFGEAIVTIFCELENSIKADTAKTPVPGGAVHPLTRYTMNYLKYACEYKDTLEQVFREHKKIERADSGTGSDFDYNSQVQAVQQDQGVAKTGSSPFQVQLTKVMDLLDSNLEAKSKLYRDLSLNSIFMMNNGRYILQKVRSSPEISSLMGDTWCRKRSTDLRQYHKNYQRETWGKALNCLMNHEGLNVNGKVVKPVLKERFKNFTAMFDEIHRTQSTWVVADDQLQSELRVSISNMVIPAYRAFLARYGQVLTPGRQTEKYVKYQPEDIETYIDELFDGSAAAPAGRRKL